MVKIYLKVNEIDNLIKNFNTLGEKIAYNVAIDLEANMKTATYNGKPIIDHGRLAGSWSIFHESPTEKTVKSSAYYADYVNSGTGIYGPHKTPIVHPSIGEKFAFQANGKMVYTRMIKGIKPRRFVERGMEKTERRLPELVIHSINQAKLG